MEEQKVTYTDQQYEDFITDIKKLLDADFNLDEIVVVRNVDGKLEEKHIKKENGI